MTHLHGADQSEVITTRMRVGGMDCAGCAIKIENALGRLSGVKQVDVSVAGGTVTVKHDQPNATAMRKQIAGLGYVVLASEETQGRSEGHQRSGDAPGFDDHAGHGHIHDHGVGGGSWWKSSKADLTIASGTALAVAFGLGKGIPAIEHWAFLLAMLIGLVPIASRAASAAMAGTPFSIEALMTVAAVGAVFGVIALLILFVF